jgi:anti-sigma regulatory factor (Ser/Thr protein kinase)
MSYYRRTSTQLIRDLDAAASARRDLEEFRKDLTNTELEVTELLTSELINNSVQHAGPGAGSLVTVEVTISDRVIRVKVTDGGSGFAADGRPVPGPGNDHWGLQLVNDLADRWAVESEADTTVWFELDRDASALRGEWSVAN